MPNLHGLDVRCATPAFPDIDNPKAIKRTLLFSLKSQSDLLSGPVCALQLDFYGLPLNFDRDYTLYLSREEEFDAIISAVQLAKQAFIEHKQRHS